MEIGHRIAKRRMELGLSQRELAKLVGKSPGLVGQWENHSKNLGRETLSKVADALEVSTDYLLGKTQTLLEEMRITDPDVIALVTMFNRLKPSQRKNFAEFLRASVAIGREMELQRMPADE